MVQRSSSPRPVARLLDLERRHADREFRDLRGRVAAGQPGSWNAFVERYSRTVYSFALRLAGAGPEREDTAQQVYTVVFERLAADRFRVLRGFRGEARFETYLFTMVRHEIGRMRRRDRRERSRVVALDLESAPPAGSPAVAFAEGIGLDPGRVAEIASRSLERLDARDRTLLRLRFGHGLSLRRLAEVFGWKDTNAAAYEICKTLRKLDLVGRCRSTLRWGEPEREVLLRCLRRWLGPDAEHGGGPSGDPGRKR